jgi:hypothetical protein
VRQFWEINTHWGNWYEGLTEEFINQAVKIQEDIIHKLRPSRYSGRRDLEPLDEEILLIASAFRVMALIQRLEAVWGHFCDGSPEEFKKSMFLKTEKMPDGYYDDPSYEISKHAPAYVDEGVDISSMVQEIVGVVERMLLRQRAEDWPVLFCGLCILKLATRLLPAHIDYVDGFKDVEIFNDVWDNLCELYLASTRGCDPLVDNWDSKRYKDLVGKEKTHLVEYFDELNRLWVEGGTFELLWGP